MSKVKMKHWVDGVLQKYDDTMHLQVSWHNSLTTGYLEALPMFILRAVIKLCQTEVDARWTARHGEPDDATV